MFRRGRWWYFSLGLALTILLASRAVSAESFYGNWEVKKVLLCRITTVSGAEISKLVGKRITYSDQLAQFDKEVCKHPDYCKRVVTEDDYVFDYRITLQSLGIRGGSATEVVVCEGSNSWKTPGRCFLVKDANTLILVGNGFWLELSRTK